MPSVPSDRAIFECSGLPPAGDRTLIMGIINVTPDSFSDGGRFAGLDAALAHARELVAAGADILDIGGESTRPGSKSVPPEVEAGRVLPVIRALAAELPVPLSIDTTKAAVAEAALAAGAAVVNDISAGTFDPDMLPLVAARGASVVLMHTAGPPRTMQATYQYTDVVAEVAAFLQARVERALQAGIPRSRIAVDPGLGFGKGVEHNVALIRYAGRFSSAGCAVLIGPSRKSFLGALTGRAVHEREFATAAAVTAAILAGADIVRVHDVTRLRDAVQVADALRRAADPSAPGHRTRNAVANDG